MITIKELKDRSLDWGVPVETVDKDWVLGHALNGIFSSTFFKSNLIFKGGTCLRKLYFSDFRFSEDLDFSLTAVIPLDDIEKHLASIIDIVYQNTGIRFGPIQGKKLLFRNRLMGYELKIPFRGANRRSQKEIEPKRWMTTIKIDISLHESVVTKNHQLPILHKYSDNGLITSLVPGYSLDEIFAEKLRALIQRNYTAVRDYYDLWYVVTNFSDKLSSDEIIRIFRLKCKSKNISVSHVSDLFTQENLTNARKQWSVSLGKHLRYFPDADEAITSLHGFVQGLLG